MNIKYSSIGIITIFSAALYCSEFLISKKPPKKMITAEQVMHRLERLMRTCSRVLTRLGVVQEYGITTIGAFLERDKAHPVVENKECRRLFAEKVTRLNQVFAHVDTELTNFMLFLKKIKSQTRKSVAQKNT